MYIRHLTGAYAGEVRDVQFSAAQRLVKVGQAEVVDFDQVASRRAEVKATPSEEKAADVTSPRPSTPVHMPIAEKSSKKKSR